MPTASKLGLGGKPIKFLGAYLKSITANLGLTSSPGSANITLVENKCEVPPVFFQQPALGSFQTVTVGALKFAGVITQYKKDIANIAGRVINVNMSDVREIMGSVPIIIAPGFQAITENLNGTGCSVMDIFGAYNAFSLTGTNLSGWNQTGMEYEKIALALVGGNLAVIGLTEPFKVPRVSAKVFGETYVFNLDEVTAKVPASHRVNLNLSSIADLIQDLSQNNSFDWYTDAVRSSNGNVEVTVRVIDRSIDNIDVDLNGFLTSNEDQVQVADSGVELRNEVACSILYGAPVENLRKSTILGVANEPIDLSDEDGSSAYFMIEEEMRRVLTSQKTWEAWVSQNGGFARYSVSARTAKPLYTINGSPLNQGHGNADYLERAKNPDSDEFKKLNKMYGKLKGHAEASYGKRFLFNTVLDVDYIDAAWTADAVSGGINNVGFGGGFFPVLDQAANNVNPNEFFRNPDGKTRCYIEFSSTGTDLDSAGTGSIFDINRGFTVGKVKGAPQGLPLEKQQFIASAFHTEADKSNYLLDAPGGVQTVDRLYVAATIEKDNNVVRIESPAIFDAPDVNAISKAYDAVDGDTDKDAENTVEKTPRRQKRLLQSIWGYYGAFIQNTGAFYQPVAVYIPTRDRFLRYGPVFSNNIGPESQGRVEILQDDTFAPWEFGGSLLMIDSMQFKVDNASSSVKEVQSANITVEGYPEFSIGDSLGMNSNISSISVSIGDSGVTTQYVLQSFIRKFGELSKRDLAMLSLFARRSGARTFPQNSINFINTHRLRIQEQFSGRGSSVSSRSTGASTSFE